jgi:hypothetical protein
MLLFSLERLEQFVAENQAMLAEEQQGRGPTLNTERVDHPHSASITVPHGRLDGRSRDH